MSSLPEKIERNCSTPELHIPSWPEKSPLTLEFQEILNSKLEDNKELISEYSFAGFYLFSHVYNYQISCLLDTLIVTGKDKKGMFAFFPCAPPCHNVMDKLIAKKYYIKIISSNKKIAIENCLPKDLPHTFVADEGDFDYMYKRQNLALLAGRKFHKKRNHVNLFLRTYPNHKTEQITTNNLDDVSFILNIWKQHHSDEDADYESVRRAILHFNELNIFGQITYVNNEPAGFVIGEMRNKDMCAVIHFEKADIKFNGIYQYINQKFAQSLPETCKVINREQDLGSEGLRQAKQTYRPDALLKKYRLFFND